MQYFVSANGLYEFKVKIYAFLFTVILEGNCRSVSIIADISCFFLFHFHAIRYAFDNLHATLAAAGCTFDDIIDVTSFHTDPEKQFEDIMTVKNEIFSAPPYPNWTAVGVTWLAGFDFEIKVIARIPEQ